MKKRVLIFLIGIFLIFTAAGCGLENLYENTKKAAQKEEKQPFPEQEIPKEELFYSYGYTCLNEAEQKIYRQLKAGIEEFQDVIPVDTDSQEILNRVIMLLLTDHPEYFWTEGEAKYEYNEWTNGTVSDMKVIPVYTVSREEAGVLKKQIEEKAEEWISQIPADADEYEKIKVIYETLINQVSYVDGCAQNQNIRSVFLEGSTVCMGYAKATQYLLNRMGIFCTLIVGEASDGGPSSHAWNLVKIGEEYYYVDTTWGNPGYENGTGNAPYISYSYLCCNWDALASTHKLEEELMPVPDCTDDRFNYYRNKGCWYETYDREQIKKVLEKELLENNTMTELKFSGKEAYERAIADIAQGNLIQEMIENSSTLTPGQYYSWETYSGGSDYLMVILWK